MLRVLLATLALLCAAAPAPARQLPCDIVTPVLCYGMAVQKTGYTGDAILVVTLPGNSSGSVGFKSDGTLDTARLDSILNGTEGRVINWFDQQSFVALAEAPIAVNFTGNLNVNSRTVTNISVNTSTLTAGQALYGLFIKYSTTILSIDSPSQITLNQAPLATVNGTSIQQSTAPGIKTRTLGSKNTRSIVFEGANMSGAVFGLSSSQDLSALNVTAKDYTVIMTVRMPNGMQFNQGAITSILPYPLFNLNRDGTGNVAQLVADPRGGYRPSWTISDGTFTRTGNRHISNNVAVIAAVTNSSDNRTQVFVNGRPAIDQAVSSALTRVANNFYIGRLATSVPGNANFSGSFEAISAIVYNTGLTAAQISTITNSLQDLYGIDPYLDTYDVNALFNFGDSVASGYVTFGIHGYMTILQDSLLTKRTRVSSMAVPGSTISANPAGVVPQINGTINLFQPAVCSVLQDKSFVGKSKIVIIHGGGNDAGLGPPGRTGTLTSGSSTITGIADTSDLTVGDYVHSFHVSTLSTIQSKTANSITITPGTSNASILESIAFTFAAFSPAAVKANIDTIANQASTCGATHVIAIPVYPRVAPYMPWINALNALIIAGGPYILAQCQIFGNLGTIPGPDYADAAHMSDAGQTDSANCLAPIINPLLVTVTPP